MFVKEEESENVLVWTLARFERRNGIGPTIAQELFQKVTALKERSANLPRILVVGAESVTKNGRTTWVGGGDLVELASLEQEQAKDYARMMEAVVQSFAQFPFLVLANIDGDVIGGGVEFALGADLRVCTPRSRFLFKQHALGLPMGYGGTSLLAQMVGEGLAKRLLFFAETVEAKSALQWGLVSAISPATEKHGDFLSSLITELAGLSAEGVRAQKEMFLNRGPAYEVFSKAWKNPKHESSLKDFLSPGEEEQ